MTNTATTTHQREETIGNGHLIMTSCTCGWSTSERSFIHDARKRLTAAFRAHKAETAAHGSHAS